MALFAGTAVSVFGILNLDGLCRFRGSTETILPYARIYAFYVLLSAPAMATGCGALYENVVGEALVKAGYQLYYYKREDSTLEQDFFVRTASALIPVEVKAQRGTAKSLRTLITSDKYADIHYGIKFTAGNIGFSDDIYTFPYFCAFLLKRYLAGEQSEKL